MEAARWGLFIRVCGLLPPPGEAEQRLRKEAEAILHTLQLESSCSGVIWLVASSARTNSRVGQAHKQKRSNKMSI